MQNDLFSLFGMNFSVRDLVLIGGGLFLIAKSTFEIHGVLEEADDASDMKVVFDSFASVIVQILILDIVFSLDSVITAVGMAQHVSIMVVAMVADATNTVSASSVRYASSTPPGLLRRSRTTPRSSPPACGARPGCGSRGSTTSSPRRASAGWSSTAGSWRRCSRA